MSRIVCRVKHTSDFLEIHDIIREYNPERNESRIVIDFTIIKNGKLIRGSFSLYLFSDESMIDEIYDKDGSIFGWTTLGIYVGDFERVVDIKHSTCEMDNFYMLRNIMSDFNFRIDWKTGDMLLTNNGTLTSKFSSSNEDETLIINPENISHIDSMYERPCVCVGSIAGLHLVFNDIDDGHISYSNDEVPYIMQGFDILKSYALSSRIGITFQQYFTLLLNVYHSKELNAFERYHMTQILRCTPLPEKGLDPDIENTFAEF